MEPPQLPGSITSTSLWKRSLGSTDESNPGQAAVRKKLHTAFTSFHHRAALIAQAIPEDLKEYTDHSITHIDALWPLADEIAGKDWHLNPIEAFVLGGAFLLHDLGNGLAAYPGGLDELKRQESWPATLAWELREKLGRWPTDAEVANPDPAALKEATGRALRALHAKKAERLGTESFIDPKSNAAQYLINDDEARRDLGPLIGEIAYSHWWSVEEIEKRFGTEVGAPGGWAPIEWKVNPLKLACLLRVADAAHIDSGRAPIFLRAIRRPAGVSLRHWTAHEYLNQPCAKNERLVYTTKRPFALADAPAWWRGLEMLRVLDDELRHVDALLVGKPERFAVRGVKEVDSPERLAKQYLRTDGWQPVDVQIKVSDVVGLTRKLGAELLYGKNPRIPLRELIQNGVDAVRARLKGEPDHPRPRVTVRLGNDQQGEWVEVADTGIGMSQAVLCGPFIDFGKSHWGSALNLEEHPELFTGRFDPIGQFGIGFFSVFMWGDRVRVVTRKPGEAHAETRVLEFCDRDQRPVLREATRAEGLGSLGGTTVRVWLDPKRATLGQILSLPEYGRLSLRDLLEWLCPALEVDLFAAEAGETEGTLVVGASDWKKIDGVRLLKRIRPDFKNLKREDAKRLAMWARSLRPLVDDAGEMVGRVALVPEAPLTVGGYSHLGMVTVGGMRSQAVARLAGILVGKPLRVARDRAVPVVPITKLNEWTREQVGLIKQAQIDPTLATGCARTAQMLGSRVGELPIASVFGGTDRIWLSRADIKQRYESASEVLCLNPFDMAHNGFEDEEYADFQFAENLLGVEVGRASILETWPEVPDWETDPKAWLRGDLSGSVMEALAEAWGVSFDEVFEHSDCVPKNLGRAVIGQGDGKPVISDRVQVIRNPKFLPKEPKKRKR